MAMNDPRLPVDSILPSAIEMSMGQMMTGSAKALMMRWLHALLRMIGERSERAQNLKETLNLDDFSINEIKKFCAFARKENLQWHPLLTTSNLPPAVEWWLPGEPTMEDEEAAKDAAAEANAGEEDGDGDNDDEIQITESPDTAGTVQPRCSGRNTKGKAPARADDDSGTVDASDGGDDIEMCKIVDNQKTPKKFQPVKRAIVISPALEVPVKRQQHRTSAAAKAAAKAIGHLPNLSHGVSECLPQTDAPKAHVCQMCKIRKVPCNPPPKWAIPHFTITRIVQQDGLSTTELTRRLPARRNETENNNQESESGTETVAWHVIVTPQIEAKQQAAKVKQDNKSRKHSAATIMEDLPPMLDGLKTHLDSMETNFTAFQEAMDVRMGALQDVLHNIDLMMRALCMRYKITPSTLPLCIPPVPLFEQGTPPPSPTPGPLSITSTISSTLSTGFNVSQLSIAAPPSSVASGTSAIVDPVKAVRDWLVTVGDQSLTALTGSTFADAVVPDRLIPLHRYLTLRAVGAGGLPSSLHPELQVPQGLGCCLAHATEGKGP
ncbi:hypothetical protein EDB86DRAFT_2829801 [Lactarius hatsudake]|nr:hypothetical protein EDB86DRAFT_2829801 [Lactarius hatsudake]